MLGHSVWNLESLDGSQNTKIGGRRLEVAPNRRSGTEEDSGNPSIESSCCGCSVKSQEFSSLSALDGSVFPSRASSKEYKRRRFRFKFKDTCVAGGAVVMSVKEHRPRFYAVKRGRNVGIYTSW